MRKQLNKLTEEVYKKMKRCRNIEKSAWRRLSDHEEHVETIHNQIDESIEQLVSRANQVFFLKTNGQWCHL